MPRRGISAYPGDHYFDYVSQAEKSPMHHVACSTAIKMADRYLNEVADGRDISGFDYFFPGQGKLVKRSICILFSAIVATISSG